METLDEIQDAIDEILAETEDNVVELLALTEMAERIKFFSKLRELISEKEMSNDDIAADVLGWAYEKLSE
jgi:tRNA threonylcarbamoyladenosine modification (KEOPS) complex Cgi121 subunit